MRRSITSATILCILLAGCGESSDSSITAGAPAAPASMEVFVNNHTFGREHGCTSVPTDYRGPTTNATYSLTCGPVGAASRVTWKLLRTDDRGDHYVFERTFPYGADDAQTHQREVIFEKRETVVFEDDLQRVIARPAAERNDSGSLTSASRG